MTSKVIYEKPGISLKQAKAIFYKHKIEKLPLVDDKMKIVGLITAKDIIYSLKYPDATKDSKGRLMVGAAIDDNSNSFIREDALVDRAVDILVVDKAQGYSDKVIKKVKLLKKRYKSVEIIAGNVVSEKGAEELIKAGADAVKVGIGPGSICTTRIISGVGVPQITAILQVMKAAKKYNVPVISDGGIRFRRYCQSIDSRTSTVMLGKLLAGVEESPGELVDYRGKSYKIYRGMGSLGALKKGGSTRYFQGKDIDEDELVPEGIEGQLPYRGNLSGVIYQLIGGIKSGMMYTGSQNIKTLQNKCKFIKITTAGVVESHSHDVEILKEAPNYWIS